tara:strand:- start:186 stop:1331 length:1146 start_codon:yes stop_codon:yes gene_type:complete
MDNIVDDKKIDAAIDVNFLQENILGDNELWRFCILGAAILGALIIGKCIQWSLLRTSQSLKSKNRPISSAATAAIANTITFTLIAISFDIGFALIKMGPQLRSIFDIAIGFVIVIALARMAMQLVIVPELWLERFAKRDDNTLDVVLVPLARKTLRGIIIVFAVVQMIQIFSKEPISSILAGLGIGGLAVALAAQDTLKHFFGSIFLLSDKPFEVGQRVVVDGVDGIIEEIGMRSTRIRNLDGHLIAVPNGDLANKAIRNIAKRPFIKRTLNVTVTYDTTPEKLQEGLDIIKDLLKDHEGMPKDYPPRVFFSDFNDWSLNILVIYWYTPANYWDAQAFNEKFNFELLRRFNDAGIEFAFPTQTVYAAGDPNRKLAIEQRSV